MEIDEASNEASASNADAAVATRRSSSRRKRGNAETESNEQEQLESNHPLANAKDASVYSLQSLLMLQSRNANYFNKLDFVYLSDDAIEQLFVTDRIRQKHTVILYPPVALRRTSAQISEFYRGGSRQCQDLIDRHANYKINVRLQTIPEEEPVEAIQCQGICISLSDVRAVRTTKERLVKIEEGFKDLVEESMTNRAVLLRKDSKKWRKFRTCSHW